MELDFHKDPALLARLIDGMPSGFFTVDVDGIFRSWTQGAERITGYRAEDVIGKPCTLLEGRNCKGFATLRDMLSSPDSCLMTGVCSQECKLMSRDGREIYIHGSVRMLTEDDGSPAGAVGCFSDLTDFVRANEKVTLLEEQTRRRDAFEHLVGRSDAMQEVFRRLRLAAHSEVTVFISGESGTGKELAAGAIHSVSSRRDGPFIAVNCSAIPETLLESELFGHVKGAFTGAVRDKIGVFEAAEGGTLFLDEIGDVSPLLQLKLLRVLQEREIRRVGDDGTTRVDVRLVTATNRDLRQLIQAGEFREDFYYRIHVFEIALPALRQRREDIPLLAEHFIHSLSKTRSAAVTGIARDALHQMLDYDWPGNVRELRNAIEHAFVTVQGDRVTLFDLPIEIREWGRRPAPHPVTVAYESTEPRTVQSKKKALPARKTQLSAKEREERQRIIDALEETGGNKTAAARQLGFSRVTMWKKTRRYGLSAGESESEEQPGRE